MGTLIADTDDYVAQVESDTRVFKVQSTGTGGWGYGMLVLTENNDTKGIVMKKGSTENAVWYGDGDIVCPDLYETSDARLKTNVNPIKESLDKILRLNPVTYELNSKVKEGIKEINLGFIAQEVEKILPEVVRIHEGDIRGINYGRLVALLVDGIKEQQIIIEDIKAQLAHLNALTSVSYDSPIQTATKNESILGQNVPNPGLRSTTIPVFIDVNTSKSVLCFYDLTGKQILKKEISGRGQQNIQVSIDDFSAGKYFYSLVIDGQDVDTKSLLLLD